MKLNKKIVWVERIANALELAGIIMVLVLALLFQFWLRELPCPLCILQRIGFLGIAFGFLLNLRFGFRPSHYSIVLISALFTSFVALRQVCLHVLPNTGAYGSAIFGLHLYTWSFIVAMLVVISSAILLGVDEQYLTAVKKSTKWHQTVHVLFVVMVFVIAANIISVLLECGLHACPDNPVSYALVIR